MQGMIDHSNQRGFTFVEILVSIVITVSSLTIASQMMTFMATQRTGNRLNAEKQDLRTLIRTTLYDESLCAAAVAPVTLSGTAGTAQEITFRLPTGQNLVQNSVVEEFNISSVALTELKSVVQGSASSPYSESMMKLSVRGEVNRPGFPVAPINDTFYFIGGIDLSGGSKLLKNCYLERSLTQACLAQGGTLTAEGKCSLNPTVCSTLGLVPDTDKPGMCKLSPNVQACNASTQFFTGYQMAPDPIDVTKKVLTPTCMNISTFIKTANCAPKFLRGYEENPAGSGNYVPVCVTK